MGGSYGLTVGTGSGSGFQNLQLPDNHPNKLQEGLVASTISQNQQFSQEQAAIIQNQIRQQSGSFPRQQPPRQQPPRQQPTRQQPPRQQPPRQQPPRQQPTRQQTPAVRQFQPTQDRFQAQTPQQQSPPRRQQQPQHFQQSQPQQQQPSPPFNFHQPQQGQSRFSLEATLGPVGNQGLFQSRPQPQQFQPEPEQFQPEPQEPRFQLEPQPRPQQPQPQQFRPEPAVRQSSRSRQSTRVAVNERPRPTVQTPVNQPESQFDSGHHTPELSRYQQYKLRQRQKQETAPQVPSAPVESPQERVVAVRRKKPARVFSEK